MVAAELPQEALTRDGPATGPEPQAELAAAVAVLLRFGAMMLRAGTVSHRVRDGVDRLATAMGVAPVVLDLAFDGMTLTARRGGESHTAATRVVGYTVDAYRLGALERLAGAAQPGAAPAELERQLDAVEALLPLRRRMVVAIAAALACGGFASLNGGGPGAMLATAIGACIGQYLRMALLGRRVNQFVVTAVAAVVGSACYCLAAWLLARLGLDLPGNAAGFVSSVLFLVPGFPLVAALTDLMQSDLSVATTRLAYGLMLVLAGGFGVCMVAAAADLSAGAPPPWLLGAWPNLVLRGAASFIGAAGFAILYNSTTRTVWVVGLLGVIGNELRLGLHDAGMALAPATLIGALAVGMLATRAQRRLHEPRIALSVPGVIVMVPGTLLYEALIRFEQGDVTDALASAVPAVFIVGAMAIGLAAARLLADPARLYDR